MENCKNNHVLDEANLGRTKEGWRFCRECRRESNRRYNAKPQNRKRNIARSQEWRVANPDKAEANRAAYYESVRRVIEEAKSVPCMDCGGEYPFYVMDFDHRDPKQKIDKVSALGSIALVLEEISKCDVVCSNCHRIRTWKDKIRGRKE